MKFFFSCDWGTSAFRLRLVDRENLRILAEIKTGHGIAAAFKSWKQTGRDEKERLGFYQDYLFEQLKKFTSFNNHIDEAPVILSGMASSSIGMMELPYKEIPYLCDGSDLVIHVVPGEKHFPYKMIVISGARSTVDVLRGEETMLAGCDILKHQKEQLFIFPGTHSKHLIVKNAHVKNFTTYMTGELFDLLSNKSILSASVKKTSRQQAISNWFPEGVKKGAISSLANSIFHVRTNGLFKKATPQENYDYLSGILIGHELRNVMENKPSAITLVCGEELKRAYLQALEVLELSDHLQYKNADDALIKGQWKIMQRQGYL